MDRQAKSAIKSLVLTLRHKLEDEIEIQLKRYGFAGRRWLPLDKLPHIQRDDRATSDHFRLKTTLEQHLRRIGAEPDEATPEQRAEAVDWFVREVAFTHLNRLAALKCLEVRRLVPEIITTHQAYAGRARAHYDYRNAHPEEARRSDDALPAAIRHACRQIYAEFKFLFDVGDPASGQRPPTHSILWPSYPVLKQCITLINKLDDAAGMSHRGTEDTEKKASGPSMGDTLWAEDEIIGWIYQFYNAEQKEAIRKRGRPRRPAEVAVINQFFTPRWIVKFLVDNTLGRLWLEMHPDSERVRAKCDYLVPEPLTVKEAGSKRQEKRGRRQEAGGRRQEAGSKKQEAGSKGQEARFPLDPDSPINDPKAPPRREPKRPQDIRLIDPACGTMHFGHYAFEVFQEIYRDARDCGWVSREDALPDDETPAAILRHNLYGVDIDLRAVQLAGLSLFIKAKTANPRAHIAQLNLVVADAVLPDGEVRERFLAQYADDRAVQEAVGQVLEEMANVAEVGSLLRVEERLRDLLSKAGHTAVRDWQQEQQRQMPGFEPAPRQLSLADIPGVAPEQWGAQYTVARLLDDLRAFAAEALQTHDLNAQLFAQEAEKTVHLLDVFLNDYDVVVMNPPFGNTLDDAKTQLRKNYRALCSNLLCAFVERALSDFAPTGIVGAVLDRTFLLKMSYEAFRRKVLLEEGHLIAFTDLGWDVLDDANVEISTLVIGAQAHQTAAVFFRAPEGVDLGETHAPLAEMEPFVVSMYDFESYPNASFAYWTPKSVRRMFREFVPIDPNVGIAKEGIHPTDASRFLRLSWEVRAEQIGRREKWVPVTNGGGYSPFYRDNQTLILYENEAAVIKSLRGMRNEHLQFQEGITWGKRTDLISFQYLPPGHAFTHEGLCFFPCDLGRLWALLAILNSALIRYTTNTLCGQHKLSGYIAQLPYNHTELSLQEQIGAIAENAHDIKSTWDTGNEICTRFDAPWLVQAHRGPLLPDLPDISHRDTEPTEKKTSLSPAPSVALNRLLDHVRAVETAADARLQALQAQIDEAVYGLYEISTEDRALIERELGDRPPELVWPQMERKSDEEKRCEHVRRLVSYCLLRALKADRDGIIPLTPGTGQPTALDEVRRGLEDEFGEAVAFQMESDIKQVLGRSIEDWLDRQFFRWHVKLYKKRPIIWHLASPRNHFACFLHIRQLDRDTLRKVQTQYLWPSRRAAEAELASAKAAHKAEERGAARRIEQTEAVLDDLAEFEQRLLSVIQAQVECEIPDWAQGPFRGGVYDPILDDGVKVNITPLQEAGVLRVRKVV